MWAKSRIIGFQTNFQAFYYTISRWWFICPCLWGIPNNSNISVIIDTRVHVQYQKTLKGCSLESFITYCSLNLSIISSKWVVSIILVSILLVNGAQTTSIKRDKFSMAVLHPVIKRRTGLISLCILYSILFFPGTAFSLTIYLAILYLFDF